MKDEFSGNLADNDNEDETFYYKNSKETRPSANSI